MSWQALEAIDIILDDERYGLGPAHAAVLQAIAYRINHETGITYTGGALERRARCSRSTIWRVLADLEFAGIIVITRRKGCSSVVGLSTAISQPVAPRDTSRVRNLSRHATTPSRHATGRVAQRGAYMDLYTDSIQAPEPVSPDPKLTAEQINQILRENRKQA